MRVLIVGHKGQLGRLLFEFPSGHEHAGLDLPELDMTDAQQLLSSVLEFRPQAVINAAAYTHVDGAETHPDLAYAVNAHAVGTLARACRQLAIPFVQVSTNEVFAGSANHPYDEWDHPDPGSVYARSKLAGEHAARFHHPRVLIVRTAWLYAAGGNNFPGKIIAAADRHGALRVVDDEYGNPTYAPDLAQAIHALIARSAPPGIYHLTNTGAASRHEFAREVLRLTARGHVPVTPVPHTEWQRASQPPLRAVLANRAAATLGIQLRPWRDALAAWAEIENGQTAPPR